MAKFGMKKTAKGFDANQVKQNLITAIKKGSRELAETMNDEFEVKIIMGHGSDGKNGSLCYEDFLKPDVIRIRYHLVSKYISQKDLDVIQNDLSTGADE